MSRFFTNISLFALVGILITSIKMPIVDSFPVYRVLFPILAVSIFRKWSVRGLVKITARTWGGIFVWGLILSLSYGFNEQNFLSLSWVFSMIVVPYCISYYMYGTQSRLQIYRSMMLICFIIAISGIYEGYTGRYYHLTLGSYAYTKNIYGLYRPNTIFYNVNDNAIFMLCCLIFGFLYPSKGKETVYVRIFSVLLYGGNILLVDSRGAILGTIVFFLIAYMHKRTTIERIGLLVLLFIVFLFFIPQIVNSSFFEMGGRMAIWEKSFSQLQSTSYYGVGPGMIAMVNESHYTGLEVSAVHNFILELFCDYGILGLLFLIIWFVGLYTYTHKMRNERQKWVIIGALLAFICASITSSSLIGKTFPILFFSIIISEIVRDISHSQTHYKIFDSNNTNLS